METLSFSSLNLSKDVNKAIQEMGFEEATPIQAQAIPPILQGLDVIGLAQTGTGKTCAFGIPAIEMLDMNVEGIQVLVLCPTRELAIQISEELSSVAKYKKGVKILPIYGGQPIDRQIQSLKRRPQIVIGTPGRVMDHMRRHTLKLENLKMMILDEADEMLNMGFREDIDVILQKVPEQRQTLLFSATMANLIMDITKKYQKNPVMAKAVHKQLTVPTTEQFYIEVSENSKVEVLSRLVDVNNIKLSLVFCNTKKRVDELCSQLQMRGYLVDALHGDMKQQQRDAVMARFRKGKIDILIATDVAARGIDVNDVEVVFNYDIPNDEEYYVHRIGRTGRAGKLGKSYTFISGKEIYKLKDIQRYTKCNIVAQKAPSLTDVEESRIAAVFAEVKAVIATGGLEKFAANIEKMVVELNSENSENLITSVEIAAAFMKMNMSETLENKELDATMSNDPDAENGLIRLYINAGRNLNLQKRDIVDLIVAATHLKPNDVKGVDIFDKFTFVNVPAQHSKDVMYSLKNFEIKGKRIRVEKAGKKS